MDKDAAVLQIHIIDVDARQLADANGRIKQQLQQDLVLDVAALLDDLEETLEGRVRQQVWQFVFALGASEFQFSPGLLADIKEARVVESSAPGSAHHDRHRSGFRFLVCRYEMTRVL
jgi:hypothetical protein